MLGSCHYSWLQGHAWHLHLGLVFPSVSSPGNPSGLSLAWGPVVVGLEQFSHLHECWEVLDICVGLGDTMSVG